jgi:hypothetical protein
MPEYATLTLHGSPYTMGRQHGQQVRNLRPQIAEAIDEIRNNTRIEVQE